MFGNNPSFTGCIGIEKVIYEEGITNIVGVGCKSATIIELPSTAVKINASAFRGYTKLTEIQIPSAVTEIGANAFEGCTGLTKFIIEDSIENIGLLAFKNCTGLKEIIVKNSNFTIDTRKQSIIYRMHRNRKGNI